MNASSTPMELIIKMIILGLGLGMTMPIFNVAVQNAFPLEKLGVVTASTQLFRSIGGTMGTAIMGSVLNNSLATKTADLSQNAFFQQLTKANPSFGKLDANSIQAFLSTEVQAKIHSQIQMLPSAVQPMALSQFTDFMVKVKDILASSISGVFVIGAVFTGMAVLAVFFLKEIPLIRSRRPVLEEAGAELAVEEGNIPEEDEPSLRENK